MMHAEQQNGQTHIQSINELSAFHSSLTNHVEEQKRKQLVCVHWIKEKCVRGTGCDYLHVYDQSKIPVCRFWQKDGHCPKEQSCVYRHPTPEEGGMIGNLKKTEQCPYFERGFCKMREQCQFSHVPGFQTICKNYLIGFCPLGPECPSVHIKSMISSQDLSLSIIGNLPEKFNWPQGHLSANQMYKSAQKIICHKCGVEGHKSTYCQEEKLSERELSDVFSKNPTPIWPPSVTCFSCYQKGHYANACPIKMLSK